MPDDRDNYFNKRLLQADDPRGSAAAEEVRELRTCVLCTNLLDDEDTGLELHHQEDPEEQGILCVYCRTGKERA